MGSVEDESVAQGRKLHSNLFLILKIGFEGEFQLANLNNFGDVIEKYGNKKTKKLI